MTQPHDVFDLDLIAWIGSQLSSQDRLLFHVEIVEALSVGSDDLLDRVRTDDAEAVAEAARHATELIQVIRAWHITATLATDHTWQHQVAVSEREWERGDVEAAARPLDDIQRGLKQARADRHGVRRLLRL